MRDAAAVATTERPAPERALPAAGWYPDPATGVPRWWDGLSWGVFAQPLPAASVIAAPETSAWAVASLVLGVLWLFGLGSALAVAFGIAARRECDRDGKDGRELGNAGLVLGLIGLAATALVVLWISLTIARLE